MNSRICIRASFFAVLMLVLFTQGRTWAQTGGQATRVAIVSDSEVMAGFCDLLTVELSGKPQVQLLEREQIQKVYREQGLSLANRDCVKLGQVLGADGMLLLTTIKEGTNRFIQVRLVAVKPGVILASLRSPWVVAGAPEWAQGVAKYFEQFVPKLGVSRRDAIPISVVNLRSALRSMEAQDLEQQLARLTIECLTRHRQFFVLERRQMELLSEEKDLKGMGESEFWNGAYLLEGVVDRDGYSKETVTISARLVPPKGGTPQAIEVSGSRTNPAAVVSGLTEKVAAALKATTESVSWSPADEARKYFEEARWALRWGMIQEAQAASEAAWALGKRDLDAASVRIRSYLAQLPSDRSIFISGVFTGTGRPENTKQIIKELTTKHPSGCAFSCRGEEVLYTYASVPPRAKDLDQVTRALALYRESSRTLPHGELKPDSPWCALGVETLDAASVVLRHFYLAGQRETSAGDRLAELRALTRTVADWISSAPSVRNTYWVDNKFVTQDELRTMFHTGKQNNIFRCKMENGCFWQEKPEDCVALYRELLRSPVFAYLHENLWCRAPESPRLVAWNPQDRNRTAKLWADFMQELSSSSNGLTQIEGRMIQFSDAQSSEERAGSFAALFETIFANRETILTNNVPLPYQNLGLDLLLGGGGGWGVLKGRRYTSSPEDTTLRQKYGSEFWPRLETLKQEHETKIRERRAQQTTLAAYNKQIQFLRENQPYEFVSFSKTFEFSNYSPVQAAELQTLLVAYKSNLTAKAKTNSGLELLLLQQGVRSVDRVQTIVTAALSTSSPTGTAAIAGAISDLPKTSGGAPPKGQLSQPASQPPPAATNLASVNIPSNGLTVNRYWTPPTAGALGCAGETQIMDVRYLRDRFWIECRSDDTNRVWSVFVVDPKTLQVEEKIQIAKYPLSYSVRPRWELLGDVLYRSEEDRLSKCDLRRKVWEAIRVPVSGVFALTAFGERLYLSGKDSVLEWNPKAEVVKVLASCRRNPPVSILDTNAVYNFPPIFIGSDAIPRMLLDGKLYTYQPERCDWQESDVIHEYQAYPVPDTLTLHRTEKGVLVVFRPPYEMNGAYVMQGSSKLDVLFQYKPALFHNYNRNSPVVPIRWKLPDGFMPSDMPMSWDGNNLWWAAAPAIDATPNVLWYFDAKQPGPVAIPVRFQFEHDGPSGSQTDKFELIQMYWTPAGLALGGKSETRKEMVLRDRRVITLVSIPQVRFITQASLQAVTGKALTVQMAQSK